MGAISWNVDVVSRKGLRKRRSLYATCPGPSTGKPLEREREVRELTGFVGDSYDALVKVDPRAHSPASAADPTDERSSERRVRCLRCRGPMVWCGNPHRPFCSLTCRLLDLGRWLDEGYRIPGERADDVR
jgi:endogenous inhibitor of DNA gyrase (YacG/DUF329 family)